jgi:hypothetical protein
MSNLISNIEGKAPLDVKERYRIALGISEYL